MIMNADVIKIINSYLTLKFFKEEILHKSWYYLLVNNLITFEILDQRILSLTVEGEGSAKIFELELLKNRLHDLIAKIATNNQPQQ